MTEYHDHRDDCPFKFATLDVCDCVEKNMLDRIEALTKERDEAWESITNNNDWFGCCMSVWSWLMSQPDMPDIDLKEGGADECVFNYKTAINALIAARTTLAEISSEAALNKGESHD